MQSPTRFALVTGATGFLGSQLVPGLVARGVRVLAFARAGSRREHLDASRVEWLEGDLAAPESIGRACGHALDAALAEGAVLDVVHAGALISYRRRDAERAHAVNVEGTRALLTALTRAAEDPRTAAALGRLCHVSSVVAVGWSPRSGAVLDERAAFPGHGLRCHYVDTKRASEELVLAASDRLDVVVVNPGAIFGVAPVRSNTRRMLEELLRRGGVPLAPPGSLAAVGLEDVAEGTLLALERGARGERYLLTESTWSHVDLQRVAAARLGVRPPRGRVPRLLWSGLEHGLRVVDRVRPAHELTPTAMRHLGVHYGLSSERARVALGWAPRPFEAVLDAVCADVLRASGGSAPR